MSIQELSNEELIKLYQVQQPVKKNENPLPKKPSENQNTIKRYAGIAARGGLKGFGAIPDLLALPSNLGLAISGKEPLPSISENIGNAFDYITNDQYIPETYGEKLFGTVPEFLSGGASAAKALSTKTSNLAKTYFAPQNANQYAALAGAGAGLETGREVAPDSLGAQLLFSLAGGAGASKALPNAQKLIPQKLSNFLPNTTQKTPEGLPYKLSQKFNVPLTKGQISQRLTDLTNEDLLESGAKGLEASNIMKTGREKRNIAFNEAVLKSRKDIGKGEFIEKGESLTDLVKTISKNAKNEKAAVNEAYDIAKENIGYLNLKDVKGFNKVAQNSFVQEGITPENAPLAYSQLKSFNRIFQNKPKDAIGIDFKRVEAFRQSLNRAGKNAPAQDQYAINQILKPQFDKYIDDTIEKALIDGDINVLQQFKKARQLNAEWHKKYTPKDNSQFGKKFVDQILNAEEPFAPAIISNKIFGAKEYGFQPQAVSIIRELKSQLGENSKEFNGLKLDAVSRVFKPLVNGKGEVKFNNPAVQSYKNNLERNESILKEMLSKDEIKELYEIGDLGSLLFQSRKSVSNPPQSALVNFIANSSVGKLISKLPYVREIPNTYNAAQAREALNPALQAIESSPIPARLIGSAAVRGVSNSPAPESIPAEEENIQEQIILPEGYYDENFSERVLPNEYYNEDITEEIIPEKSNSIDQLSNDELLKILESYEQPRSNDVQEIIKNTSLQNNLNPNLALKIAQVESNFNPVAKNPKSTASGLFQFTNGTWRDLVKRYGKEYGIELKDKNNPQANTQLATLFIKENADNLKSYLKREPTGGEVYASHVLGLNGAKKLINNYGTAKNAAYLFPREAKANKSIFYKKNRPVTVEELYEFFENKISA